MTGLYFFSLGRMFFKVHPSYSVYHYFIPFYGCMIAHCVAMPLYLFARAAGTKYHRVVASTTEMYFLIVVQAQCPARIVSGIVSSPCIFTWSSFCMGKSVSKSLFIKTLVIVSGPTFMTSPNLNYLFQDPISKYHHLLRC